MKKPFRKLSLLTWAAFMFLGNILCASFAPIGMIIAFNVICVLVLLAGSSILKFKE